MLIQKVFSACDNPPLSLTDLSLAEYTNGFKSWLRLAIVLVDSAINDALEGDEEITTEMKYWYQKCRCEKIIPSLKI